MKINEAGLQIIKDSEAGGGIASRYPLDHKHFPNGYRYLTAYVCPGGVPTLGYGHTGPDVTLADVAAMRTISAAQAVTWLLADVSKFEVGVLRLLKRAATSNQFSAMVSLAFNIGLGNFKTSSVLKRFNKGEAPERVAEAFMWWNKAGGKVAGGLMLRRGKEAGLFLTADGYTLPKPVGSTPVEQAKPPTVGRLLVAAATTLKKGA